jgi:hypothetical protein
MDRCSFFVPKKALFGCFPTQEDVYELENNGVRYFIDLTNNNESKITPYITNYNYINYPIQDQHYPTDQKSFAKLIVQLCEIIKNLISEEKIYIHCKGGHGRSGLVVTCILIYYYSIDVDTALNLTSKYHSERKNMKEKWRKISSPNHRRQRFFIKKFFEPFFLTKSNEMINLHNTIHILPKDDEKISYFSSILQHKLTTHKWILNNLIMTGLRPLIKISTDDFWGTGRNGAGKNMYGKILEKLREYFLKSI